MWRSASNLCYKINSIEGIRTSTVYQLIDKNVHPNTYLEIDFDFESGALFLKETLAVVFD